MTVLRGFDIRPATDGDIPRLAELERVKFGNTGMDVYDESFFTCWRNINPEGLLVAVRDGIIGGYRYSQFVNFRLADISALTTNDAFTDGGYTRTTHRPNGNSINGVSVCSDMRGAGRVLFEVIFEQLKQQRRDFYFGFSRIPGFSLYCDKLRLRGLAEGISMRRLAVWYAHQCAKRVKGLVWETAPPFEDLGLPDLDADDPVLSLYLRHQGFGIAAVLPHDPLASPEWIKDPASHGFGVMVLYKNPR